MEFFRRRCCLVFFVFFIILGIKGIIYNLFMGGRFYGLVLGMIATHKKVLDDI